jgi:hypothetical protein
MAKQVINVGAEPNDGQGDPLRTAYIKCNSNFTELYQLPKSTVPGTAVGVNGDVAGMYASDATYFYYCFQNWDGTSEIWRRIVGSSF